MNLLSADIIERFYLFLWPMTRISAMLLTTPPFSTASVNLRIRVLFALVLTWMVYPLHDWPRIDPTSAQGLLELLNQIFIGVCMGLIDLGPGAAAPRTRHGGDAARTGQ